MYLHKEGHRLVTGLTIFSVAVIVLMLVFMKHWGIIPILCLTLVIVTWAFFTAFFRIPNRTFVQGSDKIIAPADGVVCVMEKVFEEEYLHSECLMISIFMHSYDVHVNRYPVDGTVEYVRYYKGNYFNASHPKSSTMNERSCVGIVTHNDHKILLRQIAGVMARRICCYAEVGEQVHQNQEVGFIKFGSRVDLFLPVDTHVNVHIGDTVRNGVTVLADQF